MAIQSGVSSILTYSPVPHRTPFCKSIKTSIFANPKISLLYSSTILDPKMRPISRNERLTTFASPEALTVEDKTSETEEPISDDIIEKVEVAVKQVEKPRLVLKFIWMEKNIGLALDQVIPGHGTIPLSPYFFWPRKDAWEELKTTLESKPWISQKKMIILLNQATDIINLWQQSGGNLTT
ncbi:Plastid-specific 30S ribosomal protein 3, chloroplast precursor, putative [Ricinus communis]|uniref:Plastid-specific 30S ribosomal protein 3, chloroplast, putative n=2 Tax=Ricinus communis TaxID=3988 RepID=B9ST11_RICCO|nr:Plastid-specific 30S ribosomal protein 3, chloroplast precursor, putative [Ricinus communis]